MKTDVLFASENVLGYMTALGCLLSKLIPHYTETIDTSDEQERLAKERERFSQAVTDMWTAYDVLEKRRLSELEEVRKVKAGTGIVNSEEANKNVDAINGDIDNFQNSLNMLGMTSNRIVTNTNETIDAINRLHSEATKSPIGSKVRFIKRLISGFKRP